MNTREKLKAARNAAGLTQEQVARRLNVCRETYALYELGTSEMNVSRLMEVAEVLGVPAASLLPDDPPALQKAIAIDFDGCICTNAYPKIGTPIQSVIRRAKARQRNGVALILWTCREGELLQEALAACEKWGLHFDAVNESLPDWIEAYGNNPRKIGASEYWDDKAVLMGEVRK